MGRRRPDFYAKRARREHYPARSIYKLEEIDRRVRLLRRGAAVLDLGAAPGSWSLYIADKVGPQGAVVAVDRAPMGVPLPSHVMVITANALDLDAALLAAHGAPTAFDAVVSDMAPKTSGHRFVDQMRSFRLFMRALELARDLGAPNSAFVGKIFTGEDFEQAVAAVREAYATHRIIRPKSVRSESYETYIVGQSLRAT